MKICERCGAKLPQDSYALWDYCAVCGKNLCDDCMQEGCCGNVPAKSGTEEDCCEDDEASSG